MEMMIVVTIIVLMSGIAYPSVASGIETLRLNSAARQVAALENTAVSRADRLQDAVELTISRRDNWLEARSASGELVGRLQLGSDIRITKILPADDADAMANDRVFFLYPGGAPPALGVELRDRDAKFRVVSVDPITGVPKIEAQEQAPAS